MEQKKPREINALAELAMQDSANIWFMGYCQPMYEFKTHAELNRRGFFAYLPLEKKRRKISAWRHAPKEKRFQWLDTPVWSGSLFFAMDRGVMKWGELRNPQVFTRFVLDPETGRPARIGGLEMSRFVDFNRERFADEDKPLHPFKIGDTVKTIDAAIAIETEIKEIIGNRAKVETEFMGAKHQVEVPLAKLEKVTA